MESYRLEVHPHNEEDTVRCPMCDCSDKFIVAFGNINKCRGCGSFIQPYSKNILVYITEITDRRLKLNKITRLIESKKDQQ